MATKKNIRLMQMKAAQHLLDMNQHRFAALLCITRSALASYYSGRNQLPLRVWNKYLANVPPHIQQEANRIALLKLEM